MLTELELNPVLESKYFKTACIAQGARQELCFTLTDLRDLAVNLGTKDAVKADQCQTCDEGPDADNPGFADGIEPKKLWPDVRLLLRASPGYGQPLTFEVEGRILDSDNGRTVFHLDQNQTQYVGVFLAEIMLYRADLLMQRWPLYLCIEPSLASQTSNGSRRLRGGLTIPEIRLVLRDLQVSEVLDEVEYKDAEILQAIQLPVDLWNDLLPYEPSLVFDYQNFPFRFQWMRASCGFLLEMAAHWYRRNDIPLAAGGMTVQDRAKHQVYEPKAQMLIHEYREWAASRKVAESMRMAWGTTGSTWPGGVRTWW